ncbi:MAG: hypothetical protein JNK84_03990 [Phreatobacter sp.]|nr:hypothetical protein [Phreatobacter sp.]
MLAGLGTAVLLTHAADHVMHVAGIVPHYGRPVPDGLLLFAFAYRCLIAVLGCLVTAVLAPARPLRHALILGGIGTVLASLGAVAMWNHGPAWYPLALIASAMPCAWLGGWIEERARASG